MLYMNLHESSNNSRQQANIELIDVGGYKLAIICEGSGCPTIVLDAGMGDTSEIWREVQHSIAQFTQVCSYDRAGCGQSDPGPLPRTSQNVVTDLHALLMRANISGPYILVGHSFGGYTVRLYANNYPNDVAGVVLVDSALPDLDMVEMMPPEMIGEPDGLREGRKALREEKMHNAEGIDNVLSDEQMRSVISLGSVPLVVMTRASDAWIQMIMTMFPGFPYDIALTLEQGWQEHQRNLLHLSSESRQVFALHSGHYIHVDEPELVVNTIRTMVEMIRQR